MDCKKFSSTIPALLIAAGIVISGFALKAGIDNFAFRDREVSVRGLAERTVKADNASWSVSYTITGDDLQELYAQLKNKNAKVKSFVRECGIDDADITYGTPSVYEPQAERYGETNRNYRYALTGTVNVNTSKVDEVYTMVDKQGVLLARGIPFSSTYVNYTFNGLNKIKPEMIAEATKNAREAAAQFAKDSESTLGKIKTANQGQFSIGDLDSGKPYMKNVRVVSTVVYYLED